MSGWLSYMSQYGFVLNLQHVQEVPASHKVTTMQKLLVTLKRKESKKIMIKKMYLKTNMFFDVIYFLLHLHSA